MFFYFSYYHHYLVQILLIKYQNQTPKYFLSYNFSHMFVLTTQSHQIFKNFHLTLLSLPCLQSIKDSLLGKAHVLCDTVKSPCFLTPTYNPLFTHLLKPQFHCWVFIHYYALNPHHTMSSQRPETAVFILVPLGLVHVSCSIHRRLPE